MSRFQLVLVAVLAVGACKQASDRLPDATASSCGNHLVDIGETCDGDCTSVCNDGNACTTDTLTGSPGACDVACHFDPIVECNSGDGCCPAGCTVATDSDCSPFCGDGVIEPGETCDGGSCPTSCDDHVACTMDLVAGAASTCSAACTHVPITTCVSGDGCCAPGCNASNDSDCSPSCGNGVVEPGEVCDGDCPTSCADGDACTIDTLVGSSTSCSAACAHQAIVQCVSGDGCCAPGCNANNDGDCSATCGNDAVEAGETCDGNCPTSCADGNACTVDALQGSPSTCNVTCSHAPVTICAADGCCAPGCYNSDDADCPQHTQGPGDACGAGTDCASGFCITEVQGFPGGFCALPCTTDADCGAGHHCGFKNSGPNGVCVQDCTSGGDCRAGYTCNDLDMDARTECLPTMLGP